MSALGSQFTVTIPQPTGLYSVIYVRFGRTFKTRAAAERTAKRLAGRVHPLGSNEILCDFGVDIEVEREPASGRRQSRSAALAAYLGMGIDFQPSLFQSGSQPAGA